ncbi:MAG: heme ABC exporter ATP-binding protein CcmA [Sphingomonadales bacterium]|jgi:heme exporter protein A
MFSEPIYLKSTLSALSLNCRRGGRDVFQNLSFEINSGEVLVLNGTNGSGKSSLLRIASGLLEPQSGKFHIKEGGASPITFDPKGCAHFIGHLFGIKPIETLKETIERWAELFGYSPDTRNILVKLGLEKLANIQTKYLSEGQKRRLSLSRLLTIPMPLWLLDEPNAGLDNNSLETLFGIIENHCKVGGMVIMASHVEVGVNNFKTLNLDQFKGEPNE